MPTATSKSSQRFCLAALFAAFVVWMFCFSDYLTGRISITGDSLTNYSILKYYFNSLLNGVFPLWDPYIYLGRPFLYIASSGALNPFTYIIPAAYLIGLDYYQAYLFFVTAYYFLGIVGFYILARLVLRENLMALLAAVLLLFSGLGPMLFKQIFVVYLFVPAVWFFVFFARFISGFRKSDFAGMVLALMIICISYLPFYFLTLFLLVAFWGGAAYRKESVLVLKGMVSFAAANKRIIAASILLVALALTPLLAFKITDAKGEFISPARHHCHQKQSWKECLDEASMTFEDTAYRGTLGERFGGGRLFSVLDEFSYFCDDFFYVPMLAWIMIAAGFLVPFGRRQGLIAGVGVSLFLIALGATGPLYRFLFDHIFFFQLFRNLFFFMSFLIPIIILFGVLQLKAFVDQPADSKVPRYLAVVIGHAVLAGLLLWQGNVLLSSYVTLAVSFVMFLNFCCGRIPAGRFLVFFLLLSLFEPTEVFLRYNTHNSEFNCRMPSGHAAPKFSYERPSENMRYACLLKDGVMGYSSFLHLAMFRDTHSSVMQSPDLVSREVFVLVNGLPKEAAAEATKFKFRIYTPDGKEERALKGDAPDFRVSRFDPNSIQFETDFSGPKLVVYTETKSSDWRVMIDGHPASFGPDKTFKSILVPAGRHKVDMVYKPWGGVWIYIGTLIAVVGVFLWLFLLFKNERSFEDKPSDQEDTSDFRPAAFYYILAFLIIGSANWPLINRLREAHLQAVYAFGKRRPLDAIPYYDYRARMQPEDAEAHTQLAKNYLQLGRYEEAAAACKRVALLDPEKYERDLYWTSRFLKERGYL